ncbi:hypothetical protein GALMADRAFT_73004 [Galerina marginata CBS 339.88]|uniref:Fe2OG dioxygenase domain-containing protein n=1 Tax=Galerina marginata (strain CBS 339.88) TaxID=685588 RepID=A0A067T1E9_GALM3|nr:hypothetical protein GALMADRAFT_73004 [Galerina marginata CBS 339.88]
MSTSTRTKVPRASVLGVGDALGAGDSYLVTNMLPPELANVAFEKMKTEVKWQTMHHRGGEVPRLVAVEGEVLEDGSFPVYRHPADESPPLAPFSPTVALIREHVQKVLNHPVNHVLIQYYRTGKDYISEHSDKTIDVVRGSNIVNVSLGAQRVMTLRVKKDRAEKVADSSNSGASTAPGTSGTSPSASDSPSEQWTVVSGKSHGPPRTSQRIPLPHNSMFVMGLETNAKWLHGINHDNQPLKTKSPEERIENGGRISLTFRHIGTFLSADETLIWGQGAKGKVKDRAGQVVNDKKEAQKLIWQFGVENQQSEFDWKRAYGRGFDVLHLTTRDSEEDKDDKEKA